MYFEVKGMAFKRFVLVADLSDWTHATPGACMRVEEGLVLCCWLLVAEVHRRGLSKQCDRKLCMTSPWSHHVSISIGGIVNTVLYT